VSGLTEELIQSAVSTLPDFQSLKTGLKST